MTIISVWLMSVHISQYIAIYSYSYVPYMCVVCHNYNLELRESVIIVVIIKAACIVQQKVTIV